jgi:hypothetical protein
MRVNIARLGLAGFLLASGTALLASACERRENQTPGADKSQPAVQSQRVEALGNAVDSIVAARCDREERCANIGAGRRYESKDACMSSTRSSQSRDLNFTACPSGVDEKELSECLEHILKDECNSPLDHISRIASCRTMDICRG